MSINNVEIQDSVGNVYYPHTDADIVKFGDSTVGSALSGMVQVATLTLINGWTNYGGGYQTVKCVKVGKTVHLSGVIKSGTGAICYLPIGFRPSLTESAIVSNGTGILIASDGGLIYSGTNDFVSLNTISFILD